MISDPIFDRSMEVLKRLLSSVNFGLVNRKMKILDVTSSTNMVSKKLTDWGFNHYNKYNISDYNKPVDILLYYGDGTEVFHEIEKELRNHGCKHMILMNVSTQGDLLNQDIMKLFDSSRFNKYPYQKFQLDRWHDFIYGYRVFNAIRERPVIRIRWLIRKYDPIYTSIHKKTEVIV